MSNFITNLLLIKDQNITMEDKVDLINDKSTLPRYMFTAIKTLRKYKRQIKNTMYYNGLSNGPLEGINNKIKVIKRISYGYRSFSNFKAKILLVFSLFIPSETNKKPRYSKKERQDILDKKKEIRLKRKNRKKAILLNRLYTKSGAWKNSSPGFQFLYAKRQISNIIKV